LYYKKYRENLEANKKMMKVSSDILENPYERELLVVNTTRDFEKFITKISDSLKEMANRI